ncbi:MAG: hypothetical protein ACOZQL_09245 [Myxococcota bacterium]
MSTWVLLAVLAAGEGQGEVAARTVATEQREATRFHAAVGFAGALGVGGYLFGGGPGVTGEVGLTVSDRSTFALRLTLGTILVLAAASIGVSWDYALSDRWSLGTGAMLGYMGGLLVTDQASALVVQVPVRAQFALSARGATDVSRRGLRLFLEAGPGVVLAGSRGFRIGRSEPLERWAVMGALGLVWVF